MILMIIMMMTTLIIMKGDYEDVRSLMIILPTGMIFIIMVMMMIKMGIHFFKNYCKTIRYF